ncbi:putative sulfate exporter family transporter [Leisingera daeponensis]|uniref:Sulfate exporter family transporter n=1 Tax=Leisingera daeponensis TaxID=405746 RepID=A0ABS7NES2_9RHOB|nr:putative sulfate exporter family transporter [Leisingera daeponensis]MBY6056073.1 putative sulfate exporter family transporter [Leisingera daeponensis]MBY6139694.1 putative sulfate exporter family transporter [Leisingera daeponensis]
MSVLTQITSLQSGELQNKLRQLLPGVAVSALVAITAQFLAEHYATPAMLLALLLGIAVSFLGEEGKTVPGIAFSARSLLRLGVALLGVRISMSLMMGLGWDLIALVVGGVVATILFGLAVARFFGHKWRFAFLTAGSVAICGASAAMAISAILPRDERSEERLIFTVMGVTVLSTVAMIAYPILVNLLELNSIQAGVFLGGTIHDVAQVVGAGFSISEQTGDTATLVKLMRVAMLAPIVLAASLMIRSFAELPSDGKRPPVLPGFVIAFLVLAGINSFGLIPAAITEFLSHASRWLLLTAIAAVGMKTNLKQVLAVGGAAIALIIVETLFIAGLILAGIELLT